MWGEGIGSRVAVRLEKRKQSGRAPRSGQRRGLSLVYDAQPAGPGARGKRAELRKQAPKETSLCGDVGNSPHRTITIVGGSGSPAGGSGDLAWLLPLGASAVSERQVGSSVS